MSAERGVVYVAYGAKACNETRLSIEALRLHNDYPVTVIGDYVAGAVHIEFPQIDAGGRWAKVNLDRLMPYRSICYLDADTRPTGDISAGFEIVEDGWDMAITASTNQGRDLFWHVGDEERAMTLEGLGYDPLQLQAGVMFIGRNQGVARLFSCWRDEWLRWKDQDQAALIRALHQEPVKLWLLGRPWNGGSVVSHRFGALRQQ